MTVLPLNHEHKSGDEPHLEQDLVNLVAGLWQPTPSELEHLLDHLMTCGHCQIVLKKLVAGEIGLSEPDDGFRALAEGLLTQLDELIHMRKNFYKYVEILETDGEEEANGRFPLLTTHLEKCSACRADIEDIRALFQDAVELGLMPSLSEQKGKAASTDKSEQEVKQLTHTAAQKSTYDIHQASHPTRSSRVGQKLGNYRLTHLLGKGRFAEVYLGEHEHLGTRAAVKVLHTQLTNEDVNQFHTEAHSIAHLTHPHITRFLDFGVEDKTAFLVMDYAPNGTLRHRHPKGVQLPLATIVHYVKQIAAALQHVHDQNLIHRDLKPENMLLGPENHILLSDFGIAVKLARRRSPQSHQNIIGSIDYMAPEQIQGKLHHASDQYALGIIVYEWLTGSCPFTGSKVEEIATQHVHAPPPSLREKIPALPPEIEQVVLKALAKDPQQRFPSVKAFASALEQACQSMRSTRGASLHTHISTVRVSPPAGTLFCTYNRHSAPVKAVVWSPDGRHIASASHDTTVQVWDTTTGGHVFTYTGHTNILHTVAWSPDGQRIASASQDGAVQVWDVATGQNILTYPRHVSSVATVTWSPDGECIASAGQERMIHIWNAVTRRTYHGHTSNVQAIAGSLDGTHFASSSLDRTVQVWNVETGSTVCTYYDHVAPVSVIAWSPNGQHIASAGNKKVLVWDATTGRTILTYCGHTHYINAVAWSYDGQYIASVSDDNTIQVWSATTGIHIFTYRRHSNAINAIAWSPDGTRIASASADHTVQVWQAI